MKRLLLTIAGFVLALGVSQAAQADTFFFTSCHITGGCGTAANYGTVTLTQNGSNVDFVVTLAAGEFFVATGAGDDQYFKYNNTNPTGDTVSFGTAGMQANTGTFNGDGGGLFLYGIGLAGGCGPGQGNCPYMGVLTFTVNGATVADLTTLNDKGQIFVADVMINGNTGLVDVSTGPQQVPDGGSTAMLLGSALLGLGALRRRFARH